MKAGDTRPLITDTLTYSDGSTVDLSGPDVTVMFQARAIRTGTVINAAASITHATSPATVQYAPSAVDSAVADRYLWEWFVTFEDGSTMHFPTSGQNLLIIEPTVQTAVLDYVDLATFKQYIGRSGSDQDLVMSMAVSAACKAIDHYCDRHFYLEPVATAKTFVPDDLLLLVLDEDIGSSSGLVIQTDPSGDGVYEVTWDARDWQLLPVNAPTEHPEPKPWTKVRAVGGRTFPWLINTWLTRRDRVKITARWGWPVVPEAVIEATLLKASRLWSRKDSPQGVAGFGDFGVVRVSPKDDPDVCLLLARYRRESVLVG